NLRIRFENGMISDYSCENFPTEAENKAFLKDVILKDLETRPIGEFAIGTNSVAYAMGIRYDVQEKLPILIAEKTGPHFAVGDTCYSRAEDHALYNPNGKEIIARENEVSALRHTDPAKAYTNTHTDITIPYNELGEILVHAADGTVIGAIIRGGRFVVPGTEELNIPLDELEKE
ncbi:MAG: leucyl aminopeptidase, partial [Lachnospiraceae bacterium]|nr:leucyl aminopeptidase [Lachnospiraceae bacterium]